MEVRVIKPKSQAKGKKPTIIPWGKKKDGTASMMVRDHSIRAVANELKNMSSNQDLISVNLIGKQSTGKTEIGLTLAHLIHQMDDEDWDVQHIGRKEFMDLENTVKNFKPMNQIVLFDDIAFLKAGASQQQIDQMQFILSVIRHLKTNEGVEIDVRIIIFKSFQYTKGLPPFLRQNDATIISSVDDNEMDSMEKMLGAKNMGKIKLLKRMGVQLKLGTKGNAHFDYPLGGGKGKKDPMYHRYNAKDPFLPYLYFNGMSARFIVSPLRKWIDPVCPVCDKKGDHDERIMAESYEDLKKKLDERYGGHNNVAKQIIRTVMIKRGINCFSNSVVAGVKMVEKHIAENPTFIDRLMDDYGLKPTKTRIDKLPTKQSSDKLPIKEVDDT